MNADRLLAHYERVADAPDAVPCLRRFILDLAVRGKLVAQDPNDELASELLERIAKEKVRLVEAGEIKKPKALPTVYVPLFDVPPTWQWTRLGILTSYIQRGKSPKYADSNGRRLFRKSAFNGAVSTSVLPRKLLWIRWQTTKRLDFCVTAICFGTLPAPAPLGV